MNQSTVQESLSPAVRGLRACGITGLWLALMVAWLVVAVPASAQTAQAGAQWYGSVSLGRTMSVGDTDANVKLSAAPVAVRLDGRTGYGGGSTFSAAFGRDFSLEKSAGGDAARPWRIEGQWWQARVQRDSFRAGILNAQLDDDARAEGLFLNGLMRVAQTQDTRWWVGAGVGYARVRLPQANDRVPSCQCLAQARTSGAALKVMAQGEWAVSKTGALVAEVGLTALPGTVNTQAGALPYTQHQAMRITAVSVGYRVSF